MPQEIKFVIGNKQDYEWAKNKIEQFNLHNKNHYL